MIVNRNMHRLAMFAAIVTFCVIVLGAWVRLSHAGLGCPDWPGCYGQLTWPEAVQEIESANQAFPERPVETDKAWREMVHRYLAGGLMLLVFAMNWLSWRGPRSCRRFRPLTTTLLILIVFQALLGMWTVTLKLKPIIVMAHLLGGLTSFSLILWLVFSSGRQYADKPNIRIRRMRGAIIFAIVVLALQISLGGWTSANYAALACADVPMCNGQWWPETNFREGFVLWREIGVNYEGGILDQPSRVAIHLTHRIGAIVTLLVLSLLAFRLMKIPRLRGGGQLLLALLLLQFTLGILNVALYLPLPNAVAHNAGAALLLATLLSLLNRTSYRAY
ncbi:MAG: COX15/CtaA family protein [Gammaproteobacteria bacterium]|nr:COX15/CtaA family protein [Gammaproteobacteria bacterium]MBT8074917.1 COX15/CtaA family protein [Gammaproteobacteria bacterium]NNL00083.1 COX15/CtaA family protein [Xanthomonadales bacterium]